MTWAWIWADFGGSRLGFGPILWFGPGFGPTLGVQAWIWANFGAPTWIWAYFGRSGLGLNLFWGMRPVFRSILEAQLEFWHILRRVFDQKKIEVDLSGTSPLFDP